VPEKVQVVFSAAQVFQVAAAAAVPTVVDAAVCNGPDAETALPSSVPLPPHAAREASKPAPIARRVRKVLVGEKVMFLRM
jgi:hypothetical protein